MNYKYPWSKLSVGQSCDAISDKPINVVRTARTMWCAKLKNRNEDGSRKRFDVEFKCSVGEEGSDTVYHRYVITRVA
jgi:hypothetical protein